MEKHNEYSGGTSVLDSETLRLRNYQLEGALEILERRRAILADDMGLGKTATALNVINVLKKRNENAKTLIVCPGSTIPHWYKEATNLWCPEDKTTIIQTSTFDKDLTNARDSDICIIPYSTLSTIGGENSERIELLRDLNFNYGILDEAHNAKNPSTIRSSSARNIFNNTNYLALLSGTPIPNSVEDIYSLLNLVEPENFPINSESPKELLTDFNWRLKNDAAFVQNVISKHLIQRTASDYIGESLPILNKYRIEVPLTGDHRKIYEAMREQEGDALSKLMYLSRATINPQILLDKGVIEELTNLPERVESCTFKALDDIVENSIKNNGKVLIFSNMKTGVHKELQKRYSNYGSLIVNGECSTESRNGEISEREKTRRKFQNDPNYKVLIAGDVMNEGVDLTAATDIVHLTLPWTPAELRQRVRRSQRISAEIDKDSLNVYKIIPTLENGDFTITQGIEKLLERKDEILNGILESSGNLSSKDLECIVSNSKNSNSANLSHYIRSPGQEISGWFGHQKGKGTRSFKRALGNAQDSQLEAFANLYANHWEGFLQGNTANLQKQIIEMLGQNEDLEKKLDIASGPFSLSRVLKEPLTNLDLNKYMLDVGKELENKGIIVPGNKAVLGNYIEMPFVNESFDLANLSFALHFTSLNRKPESEKISEREIALREMHRILRYGGVGLISSPASIMDSKNQENFHEGLEKLGFEIIPYSGIYLSPSDKKFKAVITATRKVEKTPKATAGQKHFTWKMDTKKKEKNSQKTGRKNKKSNKPPETPKPNVINDFCKIGDSEMLNESLEGESNE